MKSTKQIKLIMMITFSLMPMIFSTFDITVKFPYVWVKLSAVDSKGIVSANYRYVFDYVSVNDDANITLNYNRYDKKGVIRKLYLGQYQLEQTFKPNFEKQKESNDYIPKDGMNFIISIDTTGIPPGDVIKGECHFYTKEGKYYMEFGEDEVSRIDLGFTHDTDFKVNSNVFKVGEKWDITKKRMRGIVEYFLGTVGFSPRNFQTKWESISLEQLKESMCGQSGSNIRLGKYSYHISNNIYEEICKYYAVNTELPMSHSTDDIQESIEVRRLFDGIRKFKLKKKTLK
jgi:hypothetical protein